MQWHAHFTGPIQSASAQTVDTSMNSKSHRQSKASDQWARNVLCGTVGGVAKVLTAQPFDTVKGRTLNSHASFASMFAFRLSVHRWSHNLCLLILVDSTPHLHRARLFFCSCTSGHFSRASLRFSAVLPNWRTFADFCTFALFRSARQDCAGSLVFSFFFGL